MMKPLQFFLNPVFALVFTLLLVFGNVKPLYAQTTKTQNRHVLTSALDKNLIIKKIVVAPFFDNVNGIYSGPLTNDLSELLKSPPKWDFSLETELKPMVSEKYQENPKIIKDLLKKHQAQAVLVPELSKSTMGTQIILSLFTQNEDQIFLQKKTPTPINFELSENKQALKMLFQELVDSFPYQALVLSRRENQITLNGGALDGLTQGNELIVTRITKLNRHPSLGFVLSVEREIIGRVKLTQVEETLSFASVIYEIEKDAINPGAKVVYDKKERYPLPVMDKTTYLKGLENRGDTALAFGANPEAWTPVRPPSFGKIQLLFGLGLYNTKANLDNSGPLSATSSITPGMSLNGELWMTQEWFIQLALKQQLAKLKNPLADASPGELNAAISEMSFNLGFNFLLEDNYFGPKITLLVGLSNFKSLTDQSTPVAFTSLNYQGLSLGIGGSFPLPERSPWTLGAEFYTFLTPSLKETPVDSGSSKNPSINQFKVQAKRHLRERLNLITELELKALRSEFTGTGTRGETASSISENLTNAWAGVEFLF